MRCIFVCNSLLPGTLKQGRKSQTTQNGIKGKRKNMKKTKNKQSQTFSSPTNALVEFIKTRLKLGRLLQHVLARPSTYPHEPSV